MIVIMTAPGEGERIVTDAAALVVKPHLVYICRDGQPDEYITNENTTFVVTD